MHFYVFLIRSKITLFGGWNLGEIYHVLRSYLAKFDWPNRLIFGRCHYLKTIQNFEIVIAAYLTTMKGLACGEGWCRLGRWSWPEPPRFCIVWVCLCWLRPDNFLSFRETLLSHNFVSGGLSSVIEWTKFLASDFAFACQENLFIFEINMNKFSWQLCSESLREKMTSFNYYSNYYFLWQKFLLFYIIFFLNIIS